MKEEKMVRDVTWLAQIVPAFKQRYDSNGIQNPKVPARLDEISDAIDTLRFMLANHFTNTERRELNEIYDIFRNHLDYIIGLEKNASHKEVLNTLKSLENLTGRMAEIMNDKNREAV